MALILQKRIIMNLEGAKMFEKKINILFGEYGTGKTELAINLAKNFESKGKLVYFLDLDPAKPHFRARDFLKKEKIKILAIGENFYGLDIPLISKEMLQAIIEPNVYVVIDLGGNDWFRVIGQFKPLLNPEEVGLYLVINYYRPVFEISPLKKFAKKMETLLGIKLSNILNNSHLLETTKKSDVINALPKVLDIAKQIGVPVINVLSEETFANLSEKEKEIFKPYWLIKRFCSYSFKRKIS
ncbi:hypothetical protein [Carboxydothermus hydrogenoformans]|nr:hypothetical protein [Carboxydothermus hydrogenoformans]